jgi:hypothetical protein
MAAGSRRFGRNSQASQANSRAIAATSPRPSAVAKSRQSASSNPSSISSSSWRRRSNCTTQSFHSALTLSQAIPTCQKKSESRIRPPGSNSSFGNEASMPRSMRSGAIAPVGSTRVQPDCGSQISDQAWACDWRTIR